MLKIKIEIRRLYLTNRVLPILLILLIFLVSLNKKPASIKFKLPTVAKVQFANRSKNSFLGTSLTLVPPSPHTLYLQILGLISKKKTVLYQITMTLFVNIGSIC